MRDMPKRRWIKALAALLAIAFQGHAVALADAQADWMQARMAAFKAFKPSPAAAWKAPEAPEMVLIPAGEIMEGMPPGTKALYGTELPYQLVRFAKPLWVAQYPITVGEFASFVAKTGHDAGNQCWTFEDQDGHIRQGRNWRNPGFVQSPNDPVQCVSMAEVNAYLAWLNARTGLHYRLLSEEEYEYANRAGAETDFWWGADVGSNHTDCDGCDSLWDNRRTAPAGSFKPNPFGLFDTTGNSWVWTSTCYADPKTHAACAQHVIRGGAWHQMPAGLRAFARYHHTLDTHSATLGFRLALDP